MPKPMPADPPVTTKTLLASRGIVEQDQEVDDEKREAMVGIFDWCWGTNYRSSVRKECEFNPFPWYWLFIKAGE